MAKHKIPLRYYTVATFAISAAVMLSDLVIYGQFVVPSLQNLKHVPKLWWILVLSPVWLCCLLIGAKSNGITQLMIVSFFSAVGSLAYLHIAATAHQPGHLKSLAVEDPFIFWTIGLLVTAILYLFILSLGFISAKLIKNRVRSSSE
jgi:hypothetical protein